MKIATVLDQVDLGSIALPNFQRGYVWNRDQVRGFMRSLYFRHPVGSLLVWLTQTESAKTRGDGNLTPGTVNLLLDGQQRITSLYGIIRGKPPKFFEGNAQAFTGLYFNLYDETFEFYAPVKMKDNPLWVDVTKLMKMTSGRFIRQLMDSPELKTGLQDYIDRLNKLGTITEIDLHVEQVTGEDKTVDVVVDIFNRVNTGGTKLSKGDLALAKICAQWPEARDEMRLRLDKWKAAGFYLRLDWLLRCINAVVSGQALFSAMDDIDTARFRKGLGETEKAVDVILNTISARLGLDHDRVLGSRYSFPLLSRYLMQHNMRFPSGERDKMLYWYVHSFLWGRYAGSTETTLSKDLSLIKEADGSLERLVGQLRQDRADLRLNANDFAGWSQGARFYPMLYMLTRAYHARDWDTGVELSNHLLGKFSRLQLHHVFPKAMLRKQGYSRAEVNAIANFTFLTQETNLMVSDRNPAEYLEEFARRNPGVVESHWIPMDKELWKIKNYRGFLEARRYLLAKAANNFLDGLMSGGIPEATPIPSILGQREAAVPGGVVSDAEERLLLKCNEWVMKKGLPEGEFQYELADPETGEPLAILDLAWPAGLQEGLTQPVALLIDEGPETVALVNGAGYRHFTDVTDFRKYVKREILSAKDSKD